MLRKPERKLTLAAIPVIVAILACQTINIQLTDPPPTPTETATATAAFTVTPSRTPLPTATATPKSFIITDSAFVPSYKEHCTSDVSITAVNGQKFTIKGTIAFTQAGLTWWCYDARHTWIGTLTYAGFTFASDADDPLQFTITPKGYLYVKGKGTVTMPDGSVVTLP
jgi:hypothetical protein